MIITRKAIPRRTVLRGIGATIALPLLDGMVPALSAARPVRRLGIIYVGNGAAMDNWTPAVDGPLSELSPILRPLTPFRDRLLVVTGLDNKPAVALLGEPAGGHGRVGAAFLTGVHAKPTVGADFEASVSVDQIVAKELGQHTQLASLELGLESTEFAGACDAGFSCAYVNTVSWRGPKTPLPMENNPRAVFERLFGDSGSTDPAVRLAHLQDDRSILDSVGDKVVRLRSQLGARDRAKFADYLESVRDIERRIQKAEAQGVGELPVLEQPVGVPSSFEEYARLMMDLQVLAYQSDLTRVITFLLVKELSSRTYPEVGVPDPHHPLSHHRDDPEKLAKLAKVNAFHVKQLAYFLGRLESTPDGDGSLLDHLMLLYGGGMGNSNLHDPHNLPILLIGGAAGNIKGGRHIRCSEGTPLTNLYMTMLVKLGVRAESIGDSTGEIKEISEV